MPERVVKAALAPEVAAKWFESTRTSWHQTDGGTLAMRLAITGKLRALVPSDVAGLISNCGGVNRRSARFAGNLLKRDVSDEQYLAICHSLIFPNGVRKSTARARNADIVRYLIGSGNLPKRPRLRVLDVGAAVGLDALSTLAILKNACEVEQYTLGDLHTHVFYDRARGLIFDEDGNLIQVDQGRRFVAIYFSYNYWFQRITSLPRRVKPWLLRKRMSFRDRGDLVRIPLVHRDLNIGAEDSLFRLKRMNVFEPLEDRFDLIICMHLLVRRYFSSRTIERGVRNLAGSLHVGGALLVGAAESFKVVTRPSETEFVTREFPRGIASF